jgi:AcrR family transcriptional regulator
MGITKTSMYAAFGNKEDLFRKALERYAEGPRNDNRAHLRDRFRRAVDEGDLPAGTDPDTLARYLMTMANGIAVQAATGATRDELQRVADAALHNWPPA